MRRALDFDLSLTGFGSKEIDTFSQMLRDTRCRGFPESRS